MKKITRRDFLVRSGRTGLAVGIGAPLVSGCWGEDIYEPAGAYDVIVVGGGAAGSIVAAKLQHASNGRKRILVIEAGGATLAATGGTAYPPWAPPGRRDLTMFDVPGEYSQIPFTPFGTPYQLTETLFTYQGIGIGGNSAFNGMLYQTNPPANFDERWPSRWHWNDIEPYFQRVPQKVPVSNTPSTDGVPQNPGPANIVHPLYAQAGFVEGDTSRPVPASGVNYPPIFLPETAEGADDIALMAQATFDLIQLLAKNPALRIVFGPGSASHPNLSPNVLADVRTYVTSPSPVDNVYYSRLATNHWGGTAVLSSGPGGVDPETLVLRGTTNVAVVDASLHPTSTPCHPIGTVMAIAERAGDILAPWSS